MVNEAERASRPIWGLEKLYLTNGGPESRTVAVRTDGKGDVTKSHIEWTCEQGVPKQISLLLVDDLLYMVNESGVAACVDAGTGVPIWRHRLGGDFTASPLCADGRIYFVGEQATHVIEPGRSLLVLAVNSLDDGCLASPAAVGKSLFLRTRTHIYCIERQ
jgi:outer membrane protein assembly factor BamB